MPGVPLEDWGSAGSVGMHWEGRLTYTESLTSTDVRDPVISVLTFAWFEDTGYYGVDWSYAE